MNDLLRVILPVFLVLGTGYLAVLRGGFRQEWIDGLMQFAQRFALPLLLFSAISSLDLHLLLEWRVFVSYYASATASFVLGMLGGRLIFGRDWPDAVAIGFSCLFANTLLLGVPIMERAFGTEALAANFAIVAVHSPFCYAMGITTMEIMRNRSAGVAETVATVLKAMFRNTLILGIVAGFVFNFSGLALPAVLQEAVDLLVRAALPVALFGLGGVLVRYRPEGDLRTIGFVCAMSLLFHPALAWGLGRALDLDRDAFRSVIVTAAMAPGVNAFLFADMYGKARRVAASSVLLATGLSVLSVWFWLAILP